MECFHISMLQRFPAPAEPSLKIWIKVRGPNPMAAKEAAPPLVMDPETAGTDNNERRKLGSLTEDV